MNTSVFPGYVPGSPVPLAWAGTISTMDYFNIGDTLSPIMVALLTGLPIERVSTRSQATRLAAVGTIGHGFSGGEVWFWGTGSSPWANPGAPVEERVPFKVPANSNFRVMATRGPLSERLLAGDHGHKPGIYGDPVWLLPRFYRPKVEKKWKIGVILHLSELADRGPEAHPRDGMRRYDIPDDLADDVHLITTCTPVDLAAVGGKIDEILACERIVSTSLHGMVIAESYGIPCLYFSPRGREAGARSLPLTEDGGVDLRIVDLYSGLGRSEQMAYVQPRAEPTDWRDVMAAIDRHWQPAAIDEDKLIEALPLPLNPVVAEPGKTIWQHPALTGLKLRHAVSEVKENDEAHVALQRRVRAERAAAGLWGDGSGGFDKFALHDRLEAGPKGVPLSWAASTEDAPYANLGDALSAVVVAALSGRTVRHAAFDAPVERLVGVGTIGHAQKNGVLHVWGTGLDATRNPVLGAGQAFSAPPNTKYYVHATRGPNTRAALQKAGIEVGPGIYGDPVSLLPLIWPMHEVEKTHELGVIVHISELDGYAPNAALKAEYLRYTIPEAFAGRVRIINTLTPRSLEGLEEKVAEIVSCRAILSTSLHGLVIAEAYGIPCAWFRTTGPGVGEMLPLDDPEVAVDHRMRDFYAGAGASRLASYSQSRAEPTDWQAAIDFVTSAWQPLNPDLAPLIEAFPLPLAPRDAQGLWPVPLRAQLAFHF